MDSYAKFCESRNMKGWVGGIWVGDEKPIEEKQPKKNRELDKVLLIGLGEFLLNFLVRI